MGIRYRCVCGGVVCGQAGTGANFPELQSGRGQVVSAGKARKACYGWNSSLCQGTEEECCLETFLFSRAETQAVAGMSYSMDGVFLPDPHLGSSARICIICIFASYNLLPLLSLLSVCFCHCLDFIDGFLSLM